MAMRFTRGAAARAVSFAAGLAAIGVAAASAGAAASAAPAVQETRAERGTDTAERRLERLVDAGIREGGPFFTDAERAVIERACGYEAGSYDGFTANMTDGTFICSNGRRVDTPEIRAVMATAGPRISARVRRTLGSPEFSEAVAEIARTASEQAVRAVRESGVAERAAIEARTEVARALADVDVQVEAAMREADAEIERSLREERRARRR
ncbi:MAG TPA: hypothetical protein VEZ20_07105 [Allosphingosinicella sp.]|nr:hypothetical protein [Allosphingosinicella sp.]